MSSFSEEWVSCTLADLLESLESGSRPRGGVKGINEGIPSLGGEHLTYNGGFDFKKIRFVPEEFAKKMKKGHIQVNDILIVKDGATTGKTAFVGDSFPFKKAVVNEHVFICRPSKLVESQFLFRFLTSEEGQKRILSNFQGSAQGGINTSFAPNTIVPIAPLDEQRRIVEKLDKLLAKVAAAKERLERIPAILKRFRQSVLAAAVSGELTKDWRKGNPEVENAKKLLMQIEQVRMHNYQEEFRQAKEFGGRKPPKPINLGEVDSTFSNGGIPEKWSLAYWGNIVKEVRNGVPKKPSNDPPGTLIFRINAVRSGYVDLDKVKYFPKGKTIYQKYLVKDGDLLFTRYNGSLDLVGVCALVHHIGDKDYLYPDKLIRVRLGHELVNLKYLEFYFQTSNAREQIKSKSKSSAGQNGISGSDLKEIVVIIPPLEEQQEIVKRVESLFQTADQIEARYQKAKAYVDKLTQSILAKAFRGELALQDPNDEPALVLLERIKAEKAKIEAKNKKRKNKR